MNVIENSDLENVQYAIIKYAKLVFIVLKINNIVIHVFSVKFQKKKINVWRLKTPFKW